MKNNPYLVNNISQPAVILDVISIIFHMVFDGIERGQPVHVPADYPLLSKQRGHKTLSLDEVKSKLSQYDIIESDCGVSSSYLRFRHPQGSDCFEEGDLIYLCRSGLFHLNIDANGALLDITAEFHGYSPEFLSQIVTDFPDNNYLPDEELILGLSNNRINNRVIDNAEFLSGLQKAGAFNEIQLD